MKKIDVLRVVLRLSQSERIPVGRIAKGARGSVVFAFDEPFLRRNLRLSPFKLPHVPGVLKPEEKAPFAGLFGVFADSLPDGWGLVLMDRAFTKLGLSYRESSVLDRLAYIGSRGMGALTYEPPLLDTVSQTGFIDLATLAAESDKVLTGTPGEVLESLYIAGGSPGGARPKVVVGIKFDENQKPERMVSGTEVLASGFEHWLVKFHGQKDRADDGIAEYAYSLAARQANLKMAATSLFDGPNGSRWFASRRFDRSGRDDRIHLQTLAGLLDANFRLPSLDYETLLRATARLTKNHQDVLEAFRLAVFNVAFHNRDDHAKNFSFLMGSDGSWRLAPAYDLTYSDGIGGEHSTAVLGEGRNPGSEDLLRLANKVGIEAKEARPIVDEVFDVRSCLGAILRQLGVKGDHPAFGLC